MTYPAIILIVDDTPAGRETLEELLISPDYEFAFASNGPEALAIAAELTPDLILLDVMMPGMDGFEVCRRLRADTRLAEVPVVMVTALDDRDSRLQGIEAGADDFISKPFDRTELRARVRSITRLNRYRRLLVERAQFEWVVEQTDDGYLVVSDNDEILYANPQARLYLGLPLDMAEPITEKFLAQVQKQYHCEPAEAWTDWPASSILNLPGPRYLVRPESATDHAYWLRVALLNQPAGLGNRRLIHLRDVTHQMSMQRDRRTFQDALAHKLRTPLGHITISLQMLAEEEPPLSSVAVVEFATVALQGASRLREEIEDVLRYMTASKVAKAEAGCALADLRQIVPEISDNLGLASVSLTGLEGLEQLQVMLSRRATEWILWEVLENAKKFHPQQSPSVEIVVAPSNTNAVSLKISDNGLTLSPKQLAQVWIPYYQGEKYFTGEIAGMGLGLSTVASLIWEVGGVCRLYNRPEGPGVVVELIIPILTGSKE